MISVIIPTYNGAKTVVEVVNSLEGQKEKDLEVIVVIDGSTDGTIEKLRSKRFNISLQILEQNNRGRSAARNAGAAQAKGDLLVFVDDDILVDDDFISNHGNHHQEVKNSILAGSAPLNPQSLDNDFDEFRFALSKRWLKSLPAQKEVLTKQNLFLTAANFSIERSLYQRLGGFDERIRDCEDLELAIRAFHQNVPIFFDPAIACRHEDHRTCAGYIARIREYSQANDLLRNSSQYGDFFDSRFKRLVDLSLPKRFVYGSVGRRSVVRSIDRQDWFWGILPQPLRYKLYDIVITSLATHFKDRDIKA